MKRTALKPGAESLARGSTFAKPRSELKRTAASSGRRRRGISPASAEQRLKVRDACCRFCGERPVHPAHVIDRSLGGCDSASCVIGLCFTCHRDYDEHRIDVLGLLNLDEQAHAVSHVGIVTAIERTTNLQWRTLDEHRRTA